MTIAHALLHIEFRTKFMNEVIVDTQMDLVPFRQVVASSEDVEEKVSVVKERLRIKMLTESSDPKLERSNRPIHDNPASPPPGMA